MKCFSQNKTTILLQPLYKSTCVTLEDSVGAKFYCLQASANNNYDIRVREKIIEFSTAVLPT